MLEKLNDSLLNVFDFFQTVLLIALMVVARYFSKFEEAGLYPSHMVAVLLEGNNRIDVIMNAIKGDPGNDRVYSGLSPTEFISRVNENRDDVVWMESLPKAKHSIANLDYLMDSISEHKFKALCFTEFQSAIPDRYIEQTIPFPLRFSGKGFDECKAAMEEFSRLLTEVGMKHHDEILECLRNAKQSAELNHDEFSWLRAALDVLRYLKPFTKDSDAFLDTYGNNLGVAISQIDDFRENADLTSAFLRLVYDFADSLALKAYDIRADIKYDGMGIFYDAEYYYLEEALFHKIAEPLRSAASINQVNASLVADGVQAVSEHGGRNYYTLKKTIFLADGRTARPRFHRLDRNKVDIDGKETLLKVLTKFEEKVAA